MTMLFVNLINCTIVSILLWLYFRWEKKQEQKAERLAEAEAYAKELEAVIKEFQKQENALANRKSATETHWF